MQKSQEQQDRASPILLAPIKPVYVTFTVVPLAKAVTWSSPESVWETFPNAGMQGDVKKLGPLLQQSTTWHKQIVSQTCFFEGQTLKSRP